VGVSDPGDAPPAALPGPLVANDGDLALSRPRRCFALSPSQWPSPRLGLAQGESLVWSMTLKLGAESRWTKTMVPS